MYAWELRMGDKKFKLRKLNQQCQEALKSKNFAKLIDCYEKFFELTKDYHYKQEIANIQYKVFRNIEKAAEIYNEISSHLQTESSFWWQYFEIQANLNKTYDAVSCVHNAIKLELNTKRVV